MRNQSLSRLLASVMVIGAVVLYGAMSAPRTVNSPPQARVPRLGIPLQVGWRQSTLIPSEKLKLSFVRVTEDSRCPKNITCYWEGQVTVVIAVEKAGRSLGSRGLTVYGHNRIFKKSIQKIGPYWIELQRVDPYPANPEDRGKMGSVTILVQSKPIPAPTPYPEPTPTPTPRTRPRPAVSTNLGVPIQLMDGQNAFVRSEQIKITFWVGTRWYDTSPPTKATPAHRVTGYVELWKGKRRLGEMELTVRPGMDVHHNPVRIGAYDVRLVRVTPFVEDPQHEDSDAGYKATIIVKKRTP
jgi:hypothetical protein